VKGRAALVAASHGTSHPDGQRAVAALVRAVAETAPQLTVSQAFVDVQQPEVRRTLSAVDQGRDAVVVPLLLSAGYHVRVDLARDARENLDRRVTIAEALGPDRRLTDLLARRLDEAGLLPDDLVVLAAAGSSDQRAVDDCQVVAADLAAVLGRPVTAGFISAALPRLADAVAQVRSAGAANARVVVACYLLAPGYFSGLAGEAGADLVSEPLLAADREVPRELVQVILERYRAACNADVSAALQRASDPVTTW
jgi:sirohydrochlorin ferrochelatase